MSFTANTAFEARVTNDRFDDLCNVAGKYQASSADADCSAGRLVKRVSRIASAGFSNINNENTWIMNDAVSTDNVDTVIYACDTYESQKIEGYHIGHKTLGLGIPSGEIGVFKKIDFTGDKIYRFGIGCVSNTLSTNQYCTIDNGQLKAQASAPATAGAIYFKVLGTGSFYEGPRTGSGYVDVQPCKVTVAD